MIYEFHYIWISWYMNFTIYEFHDMWISRYKNFTMYEFHDLWISRYMNFTIYEFHDIWISLYIWISRDMNFTIYEFRNIWISDTIYKFLQLTTFVVVSSIVLEFSVRHRTENSDSEYPSWHFRSSVILSIQLRLRGWVSWGNIGWYFLIDRLLNIRLSKNTMHLKTSEFLP